MLSRRVPACSPSSWLPGWLCHLWVPTGFTALLPAESKAVPCSEQARRERSCCFSSLLVAAPDGTRHWVLYPPSRHQPRHHPHRTRVATGWPCSHYLPGPGTFPLTPGSDCSEYHCSRDRRELRSPGERQQEGKLMRSARLGYRGQSSVTSQEVAAGWDCLWAQAVMLHRHHLQCPWSSKSP